MVGPVGESKGNEKFQIRKLNRIAVYVLIIDVTGGRFAHRDEPLGTIRRHPDHVASLDGMPIGVQAIDALAAQHHQAVFHDVSFDERQGRAGLISKDIDGHIERRLVGQKHLQTSVLVAQERLGFNFALMPEQAGGSFRSGQGLIWLLENKDARAARPLLI
jgi:hypothetical protein